MKKIIGAPRASNGKSSRLTRKLQSKESSTSNSNEPGALLSTIFWHFARSRGIGAGQWQHLLQVFERKYINPNTSNRNKSSIRGNLTKALTESVMSWKSLIRGMTFLEAVRIDISFKVTFKDGEVVKGEFPVVLDHEVEVSTMMTEVSQEVELIDTNPEPETPAIVTVIEPMELEIVRETTRTPD